MTGLVEAPLFWVVVVVAAAAFFVRGTLLSADPVRRMRWKVRLKCRPGPGFASLAEVWLRYGRLSALLFYGRQVRPSVPALARLVTPTTELGGVRLGRAQYGLPCFADGQHQRLYFGVPRSGKSGKLADDIIGHSGAVLACSSRRDLYDITAGYRARRGPLLVFNPEGVGGLPSTFGWDILDGCEDPAEALRRAAGLAGAAAGAGEMGWWIEKATTALGSGLHAGALVADTAQQVAAGQLPAAAAGAAAAAVSLHAASLAGADASLVWAWANAPTAEAGLVRQARGHPGASEALFAALTELSRPGKTADSVRITMTKALMWMAVPALSAMVTGPAARPFDIVSWLAGRGTIYMIAPGGAAASCAPLFRCFAEYLHRQVKMAAQEMPGGKYDPPALFALDELHLLPMDLPGLLADSAGFGIQFAAVVHSMGQLEEKYGKAGADTVWSTTGTKMLFSGIQDPVTLRHAAELSGSLPGGGQHDYVISEAQLMRLPARRALVFSGNLTPVVVKARMAWKRAGVRLGRAPVPPQVIPAVSAGKVEAEITDLTSRLPELTGADHDHA